MVLKYVICIYMIIKWDIVYIMEWNGLRDECVYIVVLKVK